MDRNNKVPEKHGVTATINKEGRIHGRKDHETILKPAQKQGVQIDKFRRGKLPKKNIVRKKPPLKRMRKKKGA